MTEIGTDAEIVDQDVVGPCTDDILTLVVLGPSGGGRALMNGSEEVGVAAAALFGLFRLISNPGVLNGLSP
jgi:hypothetical protein